MNRIGVCGDYQKNVDNLTFLSFNIKDNDITVNPVSVGIKTITEQESAQNYSHRAEGLNFQEVSWGRVIQKGDASSAGRNTFISAFIEKPTAVELFEKARNMDWRNTKERTFAVGGKVFDFTV